MFISIIVPIYNSGEYLKECVESILKQSKGDFEVILVNDGSTDNSGKICDDYAEKDQRIKVFHQENQGVGRARNTGISKSKGEFICFIDADDWVDAFYLERLYEAAHDSDIVQVGHSQQLISEKWISRQWNDRYYPVGRKKIFLMDNYDQPMLGTASGKLFRADMIKRNKIFFDENFSYGEDNVFTLKAISFAKRIKTLSYTGYYYRFSHGSLSKTKNVEMRKKYIEEVFKIYDDLKNKLGDDVRINTFFMNKYFYYLTFFMKCHYQKRNIFSYKNRLMLIKDEFDFIKKYLHKKNYGRGKFSEKIIILSWRLSLTSFGFDFKLMLITWLYNMRLHVRKLFSI